MKMAPRLYIFASAICLLGLFSIAASADPEFPTLKDLEIASYTTEVQVTDTIKQDTAYGIEYYDSLSDAGKLEIVVEGEFINVYYYNEINEILEVNATTCTTWAVDESEYGGKGAFYGWLNKKPLVIGPSAPFFYAQGKNPKYVGKKSIRDIECEQFALDIINDKEQVTLNYYFALADWTTPYQYKGLRVPIRVHAVGNSTKESDKLYPIDVVTDFAYFKPTIDDETLLQPPVGLGCLLRTKTDTFPDIPQTFQYSAEVVDLLYETENTDVDVKFERVWYDGKKKIARLDIYKKTTDSSSFQDYNTGVMFEFTKEHKCTALPLRNAFFEKYETGMVGSMKDEKEVLNLDGKFYDMGQREIRGIICDVYESVEKEVSYKGQNLHRLVVTAYFSENFMNVDVNGEDESEIPIVIMLTGWKSATEMALQVQYNLFAFDDNIWPEMYSGFGLDMCYTKADSKTYFVMMLQASAKDAARMEEQDELVSKQLRGVVAKHAEIADWRIPFLKVDYTTTGVFATAMMVERPPALLQFYQFDEGQEKSYKNQIALVDAATLEDCANACVDFDEPCKGFYFCPACFVKLSDPTDEPGTKENEVILGRCGEYLRAERDSSNLHNTPLKDALEKLEKAVFNLTIDVVFQIPNGVEEIKVSDIVIGDGPYTGVDAGDKPYVVNIEYRKLDAALTTTKSVSGVEMLNDCYKKCKAAGSECSSFSFCGRSKKTDRECLISSALVVRGKTNDLEFIPSSECDIYDLKFLEYFTKYPEHVSYISGYKVNKEVTSVEECAKQCRMEEKGKCRGFEYCRSMKTCSLHTKHVLDLKPGEGGTSPGKNPCVHYAARFIADYIDLGPTLVDDNSNTFSDISLEQCARKCSEELGDSCRSFNYCPTGRGSCAVSGRVLKDKDVKPTEKSGCTHYEKRDDIKDWSSKKEEKQVSTSGWTSKGFTGLVLGMIALGLIVGAVGFVIYSYVRSKRSGEGLTVRFMKQET